VARERLGGEGESGEFPALPLSWGSRPDYGGCSSKGPNQRRGGSRPRSSVCQIDSVSEAVRAEASGSGAGARLSSQIAAGSRRRVLTESGVDVAPRSSVCQIDSVSEAVRADAAASKGEAPSVSRQIEGGTEIAVSRT